MSKFSGKCDFYDHIAMIHDFDEEKLKNVKIYIGDTNTPLVWNKTADLIPYYPHLISVGCGDMLCLSSRSWVDIEEERLLEFYLKIVLRYYNRCKRKKEEFNIDNYLKDSFFDEEIFRELAERVKEKKAKATYEGLHLKSHNYYREKLAQEIARAEELGDEYKP